MEHFTDERFGLRLLREAEKDTHVRAFIAEHWYEVRGGDLPSPVLIRIERTGRGYPQCTGVMYGVDRSPFAVAPRQVTARSLHAIRLGRILEELESLPDDEVDEETRESREEDRRLLGLFRSKPNAPSTRGTSREWLEWVAAEYRRAVAASPKHPFRELRRTVPGTEATVRRYIQRARDLGLLQEAAPGRAGEKEQER